MGVGATHVDDISAHVKGSNFDNTAKLCFRDGCDDVSQKDLTNRSVLFSLHCTAEHFVPGDVTGLCRTVYAVLLQTVIAPGLFLLR